MHSMLESNFCVQYSKIMGESRSSLGGKKGQHKGEDETDFETEEETRDRGGRKRRQLGRGREAEIPFPPRSSIASRSADVAVRESLFLPVLLFSAPPFKVSSRAFSQETEEH